MWLKNKKAKCLSLISFQEYDPDLPPELSAAAGVRDTSKNANIVKFDGGQINVAKGSQDVRPPLVRVGSYIVFFLPAI